MVFRTGPYLASKQKLLWVGDVPAPENVRQAAERNWQFTPYHRGKPLSAQLKDATLVVVQANGLVQAPASLENLLETIGRTEAVAVFLLPPEAKDAWKRLSGRNEPLLCVRKDASPLELKAKFGAAAALQPTIQNLRMELAAARKLGAGNKVASDDLGEEMRLAARLQRDFLPRRLPEVGASRFAVLYRPASWVSGDIYDVVRLDETHVGFYVADAVGHGMPAALLTMFIKKALQTKRIVGNTYQIVPPHASLAELNSDICQQNLPSCQFCTAVYCVLDVSDLMLTYTCAGHPEPILIHDNGKVESLASSGSLLGVFPDERFESKQKQLVPGDRLLLHTDGADIALNLRPKDSLKPMEDTFAHWVHMPRDEMLLELAGRLDAERHDSRNEDDATVLLMDLAA